MLTLQSSKSQIVCLLIFKVNQDTLGDVIYGTERSPKGRFSCRGMLDFDEDCMFDVVSH